MPPVDNFKTVQELSDAYREWGAVIGLEFRSLESEPQHDGVPHVEIVDGEFHYVGTDRGCETMRDVYSDGGDLLKRLLVDWAFGAGIQYEVQNRVAGQDFRRIVHEHQLKLLARLGPRWYRAGQDSIDEILEKYPYSDSGTDL
ncbi:MAG: Imm63 family immunity protein [Verrucomicrobiota bacterium]